MMNNEKKIKVSLGFTPHEKQKEFIRNFKNDELFCYTLVAGRQSGKTKLIENLIIYSALQHNGLKTLVILPTETQTKKVFKQIFKKLSKSEILIKKKIESGGNIEIELINTSSIMFRSAGSEDSLRGLTIDYIFIDEAAFIKELTLQEIILPMLTVKNKSSIKKKLVLCSTPKGRNFLYKYFNLPRTNKRYYSVRFTSYDNPYSDTEFINDQKSNLPDVIFRQEYLAEFEDSGSIFNNIYDICKLGHSNVQGGYAGIDIGYSDFTVYSVFDENGKQTYLKYLKTKETEDIYKFLKKCNLEAQPKRTYIEINSIGKPIYDFLKNDIKLTTWHTSASSKKEIINKYMNSFNSKNLMLINDDEQIYEHQGFMYAPETGKFAGKSNVNDDIVMANAIAYECMRKGINTGNYVVI